SSNAVACAWRSYPMQRLPPQSPAFVHVPDIPAGQLVPCWCTTTGPVAETGNDERLNSCGPHRVPVPGQSLSAMQLNPALLPPTQSPLPQVPDGQSSGPLHGKPSLLPPEHCSRRAPRRASRRTVYGASTEPNSVSSPGFVGSACGTKIGG